MENKRQKKVPKEWDVSIGNLSLLFDSIPHEDLECWETWLQVVKAALRAEKENHYLSSRTVKQRLCDTWRNLSHYSDEASRELFNGKLDLGDANLENLFLLSPMRDYWQLKRIFEKSRYKLKFPFCYVEIDGEGAHHYYTKVQFSQLYENLMCSDDKGDSCLFISQWMMDEKIRTYDREDFYPPPLECPENVFNTYTGLRAECLPPVPDNEVQDLIIPVLHQLSVLCNHHAPSLQWLLHYLAFKVKLPGILPLVAAWFRSMPGVGKNLFFRFYGDLILGPRYFTEVGQVSQLFADNFTTNRKDKLLIFVSETRRSDSSSVFDKLNDFITAPRTPHRAMFIAPSERNNYAAVCGGGQDENMLRLEGDDRRHVVFDCDSSRANDATYFQQLVPVLTSDRVARAFYQHLMGVDISGVNLSRDRPITSATERMTSFSAKHIHLFLRDLLQKEIAKDDIGSARPGYIADAVVHRNRAELCTSFQTWMEEEGETRDGKDARPKRYFRSEMKTLVVDSAGGISLVKQHGIMTYKIDRQKLTSFLEKRLHLPVQG